MKKLFSLVFCICLLSVMVLPCSASEPEFSDSSEIDNWEQVCLLYDLGLITGFDDGTFLPDAYITRAEAAKIVAVIMDADISSSGESAFIDMDGHWASEYVQFCTERGLFSGFDNGAFLPEKNITAEELAKILLIAIGCDGSDYVGSGWSDAVNADAQELGIYDGFEGDPDSDITREDACLLIFNTLNCYAVETSSAGVRTYVTDQLLNPVTVLENRFGVIRYEEYIEANEYADLANEDGRLEEGFTKLFGHREFAFSTDLSMLGRYVEIYIFDNTLIGVPCFNDSETILAYTSLQEMKEGLAAAGLSLTRDTDYYVNYNSVSADELEYLGEKTEITVIDHDDDQKIDLVLAVSYVSATVLDSRDLTIQLDACDSMQINDAEEDNDTSDDETSINTDALINVDGENGTEDVTAEDSTETASEVSESEKNTEDSDDAGDTDEQDSSGAADDTQNSQEISDCSETAVILTASEIVTPSFRLHTGDQVWVARVGGQYIIKENA